MKKLIYLISVTLIFMSCATEKKIMRGDEVYAYSVGNNPAGPVPAYTKYTVISPKNVTIVDNGTYLIIKDNPALDAIHYAPTTAAPVTIPGTASIPSWKDENIGYCYFTESADNNAKKSLWYRDGKFVLQTASIPLKIRSAVKTGTLGDSIPSTTETAVNIGFLGGWKFAWNRFRPTQNVFGQNTSKFSITPGFILSIGAADLSTLSTRPNIVFARKAPMITTGGSIVFGFNSINIGYAFGWDHAVGPNSTDWLYQGKMWNGIIVSLDLIK